MPYPLAAVTGTHNTTSLLSVAAVAASGFYTFGANPSEGDPMPALNGFNTIVFKAAPGGWPEIQLEASLDETLFRLVNGLDVNKGEAGNEVLVGFLYTTDSVDKLIITAETPGAAGNNYTLGQEGANIIRSAATLTGGVG